MAWESTLHKFYFFFLGKKSIRKALFKTLNLLIENTANGTHTHTEPTPLVVIGSTKLITVVVGKTPTKQQSKYICTEISNFS